jgi:hypothetical protein
MKAILRTAALRVPPIRRLYTYAMRQTQENQEHAAALVVAANERAALEQRLAAKSSELAAAVEERNALEQSIAAKSSELAAAAEKRDALELQLYVLRSDHQRAAVRNRELAASVHAAEARADQAVAADRAHAGVTPRELSLLYGKLAGRLTLLSSEIARLSRSPTVGGNGTALYLDLLERALTGMLGADVAMDPWTKGHDPEARMICLARMRNLRELAERVIQEHIPGDMLDAGPRHGAASILMRGVLAAHGIADRTIWVAGSIAGPPDTDSTTHPADTGDRQATCGACRVSSAEVQASFQRHGLLDQQVRFLKDVVADILPAAPIARLAILHIDGGTYASTIQTLDALYDKVALGGYVIVDGRKLAGCRQAVDDFCDSHEIDDELVDLDGAAVFWRKA